MSIAIDQVLEGMPDAAHLHGIDVDDQVVIMVGSQSLFCFAAGDTGMRNLAVVTLARMRFGGLQVAALMGLTPGYVSTLKGRARDHGSAGLVREMGRPKKLTGRQIAQAWRWRAEQVSDVVIGQRLGVADTTVARALREHPAPVEPAAPTPHDPELDLDTAPPAQSAAPVGQAESVESVGQAESAESVARWCGGSARVGQGVFFSRYAGAMLVHAFTDRVGQCGAVRCGGPWWGGGPVRRGGVAGRHEHGIRVGCRHDRAGQAPDRRRGRPVVRAGPAAGPLHAATPAGRDRRPDRSAGAATGVRLGHAHRRPLHLGGVLRR